MSKAQQLLDQAFAVPRDLRSEEYRAGVLAALKYRLGEAGMAFCPFELGTAQADAWFAGIQEGHRRGREFNEANNREEAATGRRRFA